jgi:predicted GNAT family N-acyltransferase
MQIEKRDFRELVINDNDDRLKRITDWNKYKACVKDLNSFGRMCVNEALKKHGYARVLQVLAARILKSAYEFESEDIELAMQIPMPKVQDLGRYVDFHPAFVSAEFRKIIKYHLA